MMIAICCPVASTTSDTISTATPAASSRMRPARSERRPAGYADATYARFITTKASGVHASVSPAWLARSTRNASLNRARVKTEPMAVTTQNPPPSDRTSRQCGSRRGELPPTCRAGSSTPSASSATDAIPGRTAIQNTARTSLARIVISAIAASGPIRAPAVSRDCRRPYAAPRTSGGEQSATSASRGAPRMPLPMRSTNRAVKTQTAEVASGNSGFDKAASPYPATANGLRRPKRSLRTPENTLVIEAAASATPSISPSATVLAPITDTRNTGNSAWIISEETSAHRLTQPSTQITRGMRDAACCL